MMLISIITSGLQVFAQDNNSEKEKLIPPSEQEFQEATDLMVPWRSAGCFRENGNYMEYRCRVIGKEFQDSAILTLYNEDGLIWYRFSVQSGQPNYFLRDTNTKVNFLPFSTDAGFIKDSQNYPRCGVVIPSSVMLRMVGESKDWYEVEINEETRETKFILKSDKMWAKTSWGYWLIGDLIEVNTDVTKLYEKPDGEIVGGLPFSAGNVKFMVEKVEGDWLLASPRHKILVFPTLGTKFGDIWIRWRKGREILVGSIFTGRKIPDIKSDSDNN